MNISIAQAIAIWMQLENAWNGTNTYGGNVAEIYCSTLMPMSYTYVLNQSGVMFREDHKKMKIDAARAFEELLIMFTYRRECEIFIDEIPLDRWKYESFNHRCHVNIVRKS